MADVGSGGEWSDIDATVLECYAIQRHQFVKRDGSKGKVAKGAGVVIKYITEGFKEIQDYFDLGADFLPAESAEDADAGISAHHGDFITRIEGSTRKLGGKFGWGIYLSALKKAEYPTERLDETGLAALVGETFHIVNQKGGERTSPNAQGATHFFNRVPSSWRRKEGDTGNKPTTGNGAKGEKPAVAVQVKPAGNGISDRVKPVVLMALGDAGTPVGKAKLSQLFVAAVDGDTDWTDDDKQAAATLILKNDFYKTFEGVEFNGVKVGLAK